MSELSSGWLGDGSTVKRPNESDKQHKDRLTKSLAAGITEFKNVAKSINGVEKNDFNASLKSGATYYTIKGYLINAMFILSIPVAFFLLFKKSKSQTKKNKYV